MMSPQSISCGYAFGDSAKLDRVETGVVELIRLRVCDRASNGKYGPVSISDHTSIDQDQKIPMPE